MKRHFLGFSTFIIFFSVGLLCSPIRFELTMMAHGAVKDGGGFYWLYKYRSMYFIDLFNEGGKYESNEKAKEIMKNRVENPLSDEIVKQDILKQSEERIIIHFQTKDKLEGYCIFTVENDGLDNICSTSLWHILEFEKQTYK